MALAVRSVGLLLAPLLMVVRGRVGIAMKLLGAIQYEQAVAFFVVVRFGLGNEASLDVGWEERRETMNAVIVLVSVGCRHGYVVGRQLVVGIVLI